MIFVRDALVTPAAALFDLDGTLIDTEPRSQAAWARLFAAHGVPVQDETLAGFAGRPGKEAIAEHLAAFPGRTAEQLFAEALHYSTLPDAPPARPVPGAIELLEQLAGLNVPIAVVTSGTRDYAHGELAGQRVLDLLTVVVTADDVSRGKPDPEGYRKACAALDVQAERTVVFEDAPAGVAAAKAAGAYCVVVDSAHRPDALAGADAFISDFTVFSWPPLIPWGRPAEQPE